MLKTLIRDNPVITAVILYSAIFFILQIGRPQYLYDHLGALKLFGIGYRNKTIFPIWILAIILAICCYVFVMFSIVRYRLIF